MVDENGMVMQPIDRIGGPRGRNIKTVFFIKRGKWTENMDNVAANMKCVLPASASTPDPSIEEVVTIDGLRIPLDAALRMRDMGVDVGRLGRFGSSEPELPDPKVPRPGHLQPRDRD